MPVNPIVKRIHHARRVIWPSAAEKQFVQVMGPWFFLRYNVKREYPVRGYYIDFAIPIYKIGIEVDGEAYHRDVVKDYERDQNLGKSGWTIIRVKARDLWRRPVEVKRRITYQVSGRT